MADDHRAVEGVILDASDDGRETSRATGQLLTTPDYASGPWLSPTVMDAGE